MGEMVSIPAEEYRQLLAAVDELADVRAFDRVTTELAAGDDELLPADFARRLIAGEAPLRVWRGYRGLTQSALAASSGVNRVQIANIEAGARTGSVETLKKLAGALGLGLDDLA